MIVVMPITIGDFLRAIIDHTKAIEINPQNASAFVNRGIARELVDDHDGACKDWKKGAALGDDKPIEWMKRKC